MNHDGTSQTSYHNASQRMQLHAHYLIEKSVRIWFVEHALLSEHLDLRIESS